MALAAGVRRVRWVAPEAMHVTLKFLGEISDAQRAEVEALMRRLASQEPPFTLRLGGVGAFPSVRSPRVVWVGVTEGEPAVVRLADAIEHAARQMGWRHEERPFSAHVTVARVEMGKAHRLLTERLSQVAWEPPPSWRATSLTLYQSRLSPGGARYEALAEIPLARGEAAGS